MHFCLAESFFVQASDAIMTTSTKGDTQMRNVQLSEAQKAAATRNVHPAVVERVLAELRVLKMVCEVAIEAGHCVSLQDGEEWTVKRSINVDELVAAAQTTDMDRLQIRKIDEVSTCLGTVLFVYGNSGGEVIADYSCALEDFLAPVTEYTDYLMDNRL